jgi:UDP-GlcNAc3NAcA epimerase
MKIITIIGARPQFIKAAAVSRAINKNNFVNEIIIHTGQHYDPNMSDIFFDELEIPRPHYNLGIGGGNHGAMTGRQLEAIELILLEEKPDWVVVYGDTNSTLAGALAAAKLHIPVAHIEAGLRSFNRQMPEEINRILTDHVADILLAPTATAMTNLRAEGVPEDRLGLVGDVMYDASLFYRDRARQPDFFKKIKLVNENYILTTVHRAENTDDRSRLTAIVEGLGQTKYPVILPLHPRTRARLDEFNIIPPSNLFIVEPVGYLEMVWLETHAAMIATDSGGVQKEAYFFGKPCVTLRDETEWVELIESGWNRLAPPISYLSVANSINNALNTKGNKISPYGNGKASEKIIDCIIQYKPRK